MEIQPHLALAFGHGTRITSPGVHLHMSGNRHSQISDEKK